MRAIVILVILLLAQPASAATLNESEYGDVPGRYEWKFIDDYYDTDGAPNLTAYILGSDEVRAGETTQLQVVLQNKGFIDSYIVDFDKYPDNPSSSTYQNEILAAKTEMGLEKEATTAKAITLTLDANSAPLTLKTQTTAAGVLEEGQGSLPIPFTVEVDDSAKPGTYSLTLTATYTYLRDAVVEAESDGSLSYYFDYATRTQTLTLNVDITCKSTFDADSESTVPLGGDATVNVIITNTGDEVAKGAVARLVARYPLSADDDEAFLGDLRPGETAVARFKVSAGGDAIQKDYPVSLRVDYEEDGARQVVTDLRTYVRVGPPEPTNPALIAVPLAFFALVGVAAAMKKRRG